jgi:hypothetical protein
MKPFPPGLDTLLLTGVFVHADLYTITTIAGQVLTYTTAQIDVSTGGTLYLASGVFFDEIANKSQAHWKTGLDVDTWQVRIKPSAVDPVSGAPYPAKIGGQPWLAAVAAGVLEGATFQVDRAYWPAWPAAGVYPFVPSYVLSKLFYGRVAAVDCYRQEVNLTAESYMALLDNPMPRNVWQQHCRHSLFDAGCTLNQASYGTAGTVTSAGAANNAFAATLSGELRGSGTAQLGQVLWTSGNNAGLRMHVTTYSHNGLVASFTLIRPMPFAISIGDTFTAYPGCDKTQASCASFGNAENYGGQAYIPSPETAV